MSYLLIIFCILFIRCFAGYDSRFEKGKYICIKQPVLRVILIDSESFFERTQRRKNDRDKMSVVGLWFYIVAALVIFINIVFLLVDQMPIEPWAIPSTKFNAIDTLNEKISVISVWLLLCAVMGYMITQCARSVKTIEQKWLRIFIYALLALGICAIGGTSFYMLKELVLCFFQ